MSRSYNRFWKCFEYKIYGCFVNESNICPYDVSYDDGSERSTHEGWGALCVHLAVRHSEQFERVPPLRLCAPLRASAPVRLCVFKHQACCLRCMYTQVHTGRIIAANAVSLYVDSPTDQYWWGPFAKSVQVSAVCGRCPAPNGTGTGERSKWATRPVGTPRRWDIRDATSRGGKVGIAEADRTSVLIRRRWKCPHSCPHSGMPHGSGYIHIMCYHYSTASGRMRTTHVLSVFLFVFFVLWACIRRGCSLTRIR